MITKSCFAFRSLALAWAVASLLGCASTQASAFPNASGAANDKIAAKVALADELGAHCSDAAAGTGCILGNVAVGDFYDIELTPSCGVQGRFANVIGGGAALLNTLPVTDSHAQIIGRLGGGRLACVQATAHVKDHVAYYYVTDVTPKNVQACTVDAQGDIRGDCGRGWIAAKALEFPRSDP